MIQVRNGKSSRKLAVVLGAGIIICLMSMPGWAQYGGGGGTEGDPFLISDPNHMQAIGAHQEHWVAGTWFKLVEDIDLSRFTGTQFNIIGTYIEYNNPDNKPFNGIFNGNSHKIFNFTYSTTLAKNGVGLFGYLGSDGEIRDLDLEDPNVETSGAYVGGLVGWNNGTISDCYATGVVTGGDDVGGLVGFNWHGTISNCYATGAVTGGNNLGGLVGENVFGTISNCYATGVVTGGDSSYYLGGLVGYNYYGTIIYCYATVAVSGGDVEDSCVGGLIGCNYYGRVSNCYVNGSVSGSGEYSNVGGLIGWNYYGSVSYCDATGSAFGRYDVGGLIGDNEHSSVSYCFATVSVSGGSDYDSNIGGLIGLNESGSVVSDCYATGSVSGVSSVGGLVGQNADAAISNCYATGTVTGDDDLGGLVGGDESGSYTKSFWDETVNAGLSGIGNTSDPNVIAETTENMQKSGTFTSVGWDFVGSGDNEPNDFWRMCVDDLDYPKLSWQFADGDLLCPDGVGLLDLFYFVSHWLEIDCETANNYCRRADFNFSGRVDLVDYNIFRSNWQKK